MRASRKPGMLAARVTWPGLAGQQPEFRRCAPVPAPSRAAGPPASRDSGQAPCPSQRMRQSLSAPRRSGYGGAEPSVPPASWGYDWGYFISLTQCSTAISGICAKDSTPTSGIPTSLRWHSLAAARQWQAYSVLTRLHRPQLGRHRGLQRYHGNERLFLRARRPLPPCPSPRPHSAPPRPSTARS